MLTAPNHTCCLCIYKYLACPPLLISSFLSSPSTFLSFSFSWHGPHTYLLHLPSPFHSQAVPVRDVACVHSDRASFETSNHVPRCLCTPLAKMIRTTNSQIAFQALRSSSKMTHAHACALGEPEETNVQPVGKEWNVRYGRNSIFELRKNISTLCQILCLRFAGSMVSFQGTACVVSENEIRALVVNLGIGCILVLVLVRECWECILETVMSFSTTLFLYFKRKVTCFCSQETLSAHLRNQPTSHH